MSNVKTSVLILCVAVALSFLAATTVQAQSSDALSKQAAWQPPGVEEVKTQAFTWLKENEADEPALARATELWSALPETPSGDDLLSCLSETFALADQQAAGLARLCAQPKSELLLPEQPWLRDSETAPLLAANMRLLYGRWLAHQELFDESLQQLSELKPADVVAPALLLFYQGVSYHTLLDKEEGLKVIDELLENADQSPRRYVAVAMLMQQDLEGLEEDSLDHIARQMQDIERRLDLGRGGKKVRKAEDDVIEALDKIIKKIEEQQAQQCKSGSGMQDNIRSSSPAPDSMPIGGKGPGRVTKKNIGSSNGWGDMPPKEREEAIQALGREFPSHYRDVIEQYFRKLAAAGSE